MDSHYASRAASAVAIRAGRERIAGLAAPRWYYIAAAYLMIDGLQAFGIVDRLVYGGWPGKPGDKITESLNILLILASAALFARGGRGTRAVGTGANYALGLAGFLLCSALWSVDRGATIRPGLVYLAVVVGSIGIASNHEPDEYLHLLARIGFWVAIASLVLLAVSPANAVTDAGFEGIFTQKNVLGEAMQIGALASLHGLRVGKGRRLRSAVYLATATVVAVMSASVTSCLIIFVCCGASAVTALMRRGGLARFLAIIGIFVAVPAIVYVAAFPDSLIQAVGKNPTLSGRTLIWAYVTPYIWQRPVLGFGYFAFWSHNNPAAVAIAQSLGFPLAEAHNGFLEALLDLGVVGTALILFLLVRTVAISIRCLRTAEMELALTCLLCCVSIVLLGISEEVMVPALQSTTSVFFITGFMCEKAVRAAQQGEARRVRGVGSNRAVGALSSPAGWRSRSGTQAMRRYGQRRGTQEGGTA